MRPTVFEPMDFSAQELLWLDWCREQGRRPIPVRIVSREEMLERYPEKKRGN